MPKTYPIIKFGEIQFSDDDFVTANLVEEFSPLSITLPINTLNFSVHSSDTNFSIINPTGSFESLATQQPMALYESVDGSEKYLGQFYLDEWKNKSENVKQFSCFDVVGLLDKYEYPGGVWLTPTTVAVLVADILDPMGIEYTIDPDVAAITLTGWIPISSRREALQQVTFAASAYVLSSRLDSLVIGKLSQIAITNSGIRTGVSHTGQTRVYQLRWRKTQSIVYSSGGAVTRGIRSGVSHTGQSGVYMRRWRVSQWEGVKPVVDIPSEEQAGREVTLRAQITGLEVTAHDITLGTGSKELLNKSMAAGFHEIRFPQPMHTLSITGGTIVGSLANYALINVSAPGVVVLTGLVYEVAEKIFSQYLPDVPGRKDNIITITNATLVNSNNGADICTSIFNYYQQRYKQTMKLFAPSAYTDIGATVDLETLYSNRLLGVIEKMTTDLVGGYVSQTEVIGVI